MIFDDLKKRNLPAICFIKGKARHTMQYGKNSRNQLVKYTRVQTMSLRDDYFSHLTEVLENAFDDKIDLLELSDYLVEPIFHYKNYKKSINSIAHNIAKKLELK